MDENISVEKSSLDSSRAVSWRPDPWMMEGNGFVVRDYSAVESGNDEPVVYIIKASDILDVVADAVSNNKKIAVYAVGQRVLDLS